MINSSQEVLVQALRDCGAAGAYDDYGANLMANALRAALSSEPALDRKALVTALRAAWHNGWFTTGWRYKGGIEDAGGKWLAVLADFLRARLARGAAEPSATAPAPSEAVYDDAMSRRVWLDRGDPPSAPSPDALAERKLRESVEAFAVEYKRAGAGSDDEGWLWLEILTAARALREPSVEDVARELAKSEWLLEGPGPYASERALALVRAVNAARERARGTR